MLICSISWIKGLTLFKPKLIHMIIKRRWVMRNLWCPPLLQLHSFLKSKGSWLMWKKKWEYLNRQGALLTKLKLNSKSSKYLSRILSRMENCLCINNLLIIINQNNLFPRACNHIKPLKTKSRWFRKIELNYRCLIANLAWVELKRLSLTSHWYIIKALA